MWRGGSEIDGRLTHPVLTTYTDKSHRAPYSTKPPRVNSRTSKVLILTPTRELAAQCLSMFLAVSRFTGLTASLVVGGSKNVQAQAAELRKRPDFIVATPGRMNDHIANARGFSLDDVAVLVLDEADRLLDLGFADEVMEIVKACPKKRQTMLFSATFTTKVAELEALSMSRPVRVKASSTAPGGKVEVAPRLVQEFVRVRSGNEANRPAILLSLLHRSFPRRVIVFFDTKKAAHEMCIAAGLCGMKVSEMHGDLTQTQRLEGEGGMGSFERSSIVRPRGCRRGGFVCFSVQGGNSISNRVSRSGTTHSPPFARPQRSRSSRRGRATCSCAPTSQRGESTSRG